MFLKPSYQVLSEIIRHGSFTKAGQALGMSSVAVGKHVKQLEQHLGFRLFHRTTRNVTPTSSALKLHEALQRSEGFLSEIYNELSDDQTRPSGQLKINVPMSYGEQYLAKPLADYAARYPDVIVDVDFDDKRVHLIEEGYDAVVRIGVLEDSGLIARHISDFPIELCAAPSLLEKLNAPQSPADLKSWPAICYSNAVNPTQWAFVDEAQKIANISVKPALYANSAAMMKQACLAGVGAAMLPRFICQKELDNGQLIRLLPAYQDAQQRAVYVVYPDKNFTPLKVRAFIDTLTSHASLSD